MNEFFLTQVKHNINGTFDKGVVVKTSLDAARQSFYAYLGAYAFGNDANVDYVACSIMDSNGRITDSCVYFAPAPAPVEEG